MSPPERPNFELPGSLEGDPDARNVHVDVYGSQLDLPVKAGQSDAPPKTWRECFTRLNRSLMRIVIGPLEVIAELPDATIRLIRGTTTSHPKLENRVQSAYELVDRDEAKAQEVITEVSQSTPPALPPGQVTQTPRTDEPVAGEQAVLDIETRLIEKLHELRRKGIFAHIVFTSNGTPMIVLTDEVTGTAAKTLGDDTLQNIKPVNDSR